MMVDNGGPAADLIDAYMARVANAATALPPGERQDLVREVRAHIDASLQEVGSRPTEAQIRNVLDELGEPELMLETQERQNGSSSKIIISAAAAIMAVVISFTRFVPCGLLVGLALVAYSRSIKGGERRVVLLFALAASLATLALWLVAGLGPYRSGGSEAG